MVLKILLNYILGYVRIKVESVFIERFLNICISKKILIWNIKREKATILYANVGIQEFKKIKSIAKKTKSTIKIQEKKGIPFIMHRYRKRKIFAILFALVIIGIIGMSNFVWNIEIVGDLSVSKEELIEQLHKEGLKIGTAKNNINTTQIINKIRLLRDDISWMGINIEGTNVIVEIKEADKAPDIIDKSEYCNIVSNKTGIITKINVQDGIGAVNVGDIVQTGDILVFGFLEGKYTGTRYVHAIADVEAKVWYSKKEKFYFNQQIPVKTGNTETRYSINIKDFKINFYKTLSKFQNYDTINETKKIMLFPNFYLPIEIIKKTNKEYQLVDKTYTEQELTEIGVKKIETEISKEIAKESNIINKQVNTYKQAEYMEIEVIYEVIEQIGTEEKIVF